MLIAEFPIAMTGSISENPPVATALPLIPRNSLEEYVRAMEEDGFVYFPEVLNASEIAAIREAMVKLTVMPENYDRYHDPIEEGYLQKSINNAFNRDPVFSQFLDRPEIIDLIEAVHGADCHRAGRRPKPKGGPTATQRCPSKRAPNPRGPMARTVPLRLLGETHCRIRSIRP